MVVICGNSTLMMRAAQMVLICNPPSGATPRGNGNWNDWAVVGAVDANAANASASAALATFGGLAGAGSALVGLAAGVGAQHGAFVASAWRSVPCA